MPEVNNYRIRDYDHSVELIKANIKDDPEGGIDAALKLYVRDSLPPDREGLIAVIHPFVEYSNEFICQIHGVAKAIAMAEGRPVFFVMTESRWRLLLLGEVRVSEETGEEFPWHDDEEGGEFANDQFVGHYDPDGSWHVDSIS